MRLLSNIFYYLFFASVIFILSLPFTSSLFLPAVISLISAIPFYLLFKKKLYINKINRSRLQLKSFLEYIHNSVSSGKTLTKSIIDSRKEMLLLYGEKSAIISGIDKFIKENTMGSALTDSLERIVQNIECPEGKTIMELLSSERILGPDITKLLKQSIGILTDSIDVSKDISSELSQKRLESLIMSGMPFFMAWNLKLGFPGYFTPVLSSSSGKIIFIIILIASLAVLYFSLSIYNKIYISYNTHNKEPKLPFNSLILYILKSQSKTLVSLKNYLTKIGVKISLPYFRKTFTELGVITKRANTAPLEYLLIKLIISFIWLIVFLPLMFFGLPAVPALILYFVLFLSLDLFIHQQGNYIQRIRIIEFPNFISLIEAMLACGVNVRHSIQKSISLYMKSNPPIKDEILVLSNKIETGISLEKSLEEYSVKFDIPEISSVFLLISRYHVMGNPEILNLIKIQSDGCRRRARSEASREIERVSVKLLIPMLMQFFLVAILAILPALMESGLFVL